MLLQLHITITDLYQPRIWFTIPSVSPGAWSYLQGSSVTQALPFKQAWRAGCVMAGITGYAIPYKLSLLWSTGLWFRPKRAFIQ